jgi:transcriptional regulator with PAS, ATPase and Fis domain
MRVGGSKELAVNVRIVAATNKNLAEEVKNGRFREDLYYRLNVIQIAIPPLRERKSDIPLLAEFFLKKHGIAAGGRVSGISAEVMDFFLECEWKGNVRELEHVIERAVVMGVDKVISMRDIPREMLSSGAVLPDTAGGDSGIARFVYNRIAAEKKDLASAMEEIEREVISKALKESNGNRSTAAKILGITRQVLEYKLKSK